LALVFLACTLLTIWRILQPVEEKFVITGIGHNDETDIYLVRIKGSQSQSTNLTKSATSEYDPAFSPNRREVAFVAASEPWKSGLVLWLMNVDGTNRRNVTDRAENQLLFGPTWSPDGMRIAFAKFDNHFHEKTELFVIDKDGKNRKSLGHGLLPSWSPDGQQIVFTVFEGRHWWETKLYTMDADGQNRRRLMEQSASSARWSPDGKRIVFVEGDYEDEEKAPQVAIVNADG
jgi:Tol biopolymer transport system component